jgi:hypothetical protein
MAVPKDHGLDHCRELFADLEAECRKAAARGANPDPERLAAILTQALDHAEHRPAVVRFLAAYVARTATGLIPKYQHFDPLS